MLTRVFTPLLLTAALAGCTSTEVPRTTTGASPIASTSAAATPDTDGVIARFTNDIWPAVEGYRAPGQGSPNYRRYIAIIDPQFDGPARNALFEDVRSLGTTGRNKETDEVESYSTGPLILAEASLAGLQRPNATLTICYTYTSVTQRTIKDPQVQTPAASEATVELRKTDNWYLHAITNDHVVQGCPASPKV